MSRRPADVLGGLLIGALFAFNVLRAATQAITHDEAMAWRYRVAVTWLEYFVGYDANHHVLHSLLCRLSTAAFGNSELALRLPSLCGGFGFLVLARVLCRRLFADPWLALLLQAVLSVNPLVLDYLSAARGYGLALAFQAGALLCVLRWLTALGETGLAPAQHWSLAMLARQRGAGAARNGTQFVAIALASLCFGLAVLANLTFLVSAAACASAAAGLALRSAWRRPGAMLAFAWTWAWPAVIALLMFGLPLVNARRIHFYYGEASAWASVRSVVDAALNYDYRLAPAVVGALTAAALLAVVSCWGVAWSTRASPSAVPLRLFAGMLAACGALHGVMHAAFATPYPSERTALHLVVPCVLTLGLALQELEKSPRLRRRLGLAARALLVLIVARFALQLQVHHYRTWRLDADGKRVVAWLEALSAEVRHPLRIAATSTPFESLMFFPEMRDPARVAGLDTVIDPKLTYDAFVLVPGLIPGLGPKIVERGADRLVVEWPALGGGSITLQLVERWCNDLGLLLAVPR